MAETEYAPVTPLSALSVLCGSNSASVLAWQRENRPGGLRGGRVVAARWELGGTVLYWRSRGGNVGRPAIVR